MADREAHDERAERPRAEEDFAAALRTLRLDAGQPSFRAMAKAVGCISHTTLFEAATGSRLPSWPTTRAFVRACGGDEEEWHRRWTTAAGGGEPSSAPTVAQPPPAPPPQPAPPGPVTQTPTARRIALPRRPGLPRLWTHAFSLALGLVLGVSGTLALVSGRAPATAPDATGCASANGAAPNPAAPSAGGQSAGDLSGLSWVAHTAFDEQAFSSTEFALPVRAPMPPGDTLVVSITLTGGCPGPVTVTDSRNDRFQLVGDVTASPHHRVLVLAAFDASALTTADSIHASYPRASTYRVSVDEFRATSAAYSASTASTTSTADATARATDRPTDAAFGTGSPAAVPR
ncbi:helix-turn-helix domain-containing protein [Kitasatospora sp. NPDC093550]|uniref:helix-turn-helix domain-containing protein n=1 Tax=Kitasatospora sp. NPDC093550 TaxID=3364089 RepID=UPI003808E1F8